MRSFKQFLKESSSEKIFYHGSTDKKLEGKNGIHVGTKQAAKEALEARIGVPAEGEWDGTREYGKTLLAGQKTLREREKKGEFVNTGFNADSPEEDYYPTERKDNRATYSDRTPIPFDCKPIVFPVKIIGKMSNSFFSPHTDSQANGLMKRSLNSGKAKSGFYYKNIAEDEGSISAVVPDKSFLEILA